MQCATWFDSTDAGQGRGLGTSVWCVYTYLQRSFLPRLRDRALPPRKVGQQLISSDHISGERGGRGGGREGEGKRGRRREERGGEEEEEEGGKGTVCNNVTYVDLASRVCPTFCCFHYS